MTSRLFGLWEGRFVHITILKLKKEYLWNNSRKKETEVGTGFFGTLSSFFVHVFDLQPSGTAFGHQVKKMPEKTRLSPKKARSDLRLFFSRIIPKNIPFSCNFPKKSSQKTTKPWIFLIPGYPCMIPGYQVPGKYPGIGYPGMGSAVSTSG